MLITIEHPVLNIRCAFHVEKLLASLGMSEVDINRFSPNVPPDLMEYANLSAKAVHAFIKEWVKDPKPILPDWCVYIYVIVD